MTNESHQHNENVRLKLIASKSRLQFRSSPISIATPIRWQY